MIEQIARYLCRADGYDPDLIGVSGRPRWCLYARQARHTLPLLVEAWEEGFDAGERDAFDLDENPDHECIPNPYRQEQA